MTVTGIIMECNPFHEGHAYLLKEARRRTCADYIVVAMSGDYVQRGEPAVFDKYIRAEQILRAGADLVLELPLYAACGSAEYFAKGAVALLDRLGVVTDLCFGSESGDTDYIMRYARMLAMAEDGILPAKDGFMSAEDETISAEDGTISAEGEVFSAEDRIIPTQSGAISSDDEAISADDGVISADDGVISAEESLAGGKEAVSRYRRLLQSGLRKGLSFPAARAAALEAAFHWGAAEESSAKASVSEGRCQDDIFRASAGQGYPSSPNDLLAVEYCRALLSLGSSIRPHAIPRIEVPSATERRAQLHEERRKGLSFARNLFSGQKTPSLPVLSGEKRGLDHCDPDRFLVKDVPLFPLFPDDFSFQLLYALQMFKDDAQSFADISDDLAERIRKLLPQYTGFTQFRDLLKTRNLTLTRVSRSLLHLLLAIKKEKLERLQFLGMALYARPLALNRSSAPLCSMISSCSSIPFISRLSSAGSLLNKEEMAFLEEEIRAEEFYTMTLHAVFSRCTKDDKSYEGWPSALRRRQVFLDRR